MRSLLARTRHLPQAEVASMLALGTMETQTPAWWHCSCKVNKWCTKSLKTTIIDWSGPVGRNNYTPSTDLVLTLNGVCAPVWYGHASNVPRSHVYDVVFMRKDGMRIPGMVEEQYHTIAWISAKAQTRNVEEIVPPSVAHSITELFTFQAKTQFASCVHHSRARKIC